MGRGTALFNKRTPPGDGESEVKTVEGTVWKWCTRCRSWRSGTGAHTTTEHRVRDPDVNPQGAVASNHGLQMSNLFTCVEIKRTTETDEDPDLNSSLQSVKATPIINRLPYALCFEIQNYKAIMNHRINLELKQEMTEGLLQMLACKEQWYKDCIAQGCWVDVWHECRNSVNTWYECTEYESGDPKDCAGEV